ncbi:MAG TPA: hypothetical protein PLA90_12830, partial [Candidatus Sumerlaeota bacterium]|nr:hypothetical protein [Candidatus Sumerlaeota bacterium]
KARAATKQAEYRLAEHLKNSQTSAQKATKELEELRQQVLILRQSLHDLKSSTVPESEVFELQAAYDSTKADLLRLKASMKRTEADDSGSAQEIEQLKSDYRELQRKHTDLQTEYQKRQAESIPKSRVAELQSAYELLGAKYQALKKAAGNPPTLMAGLAASGPKPVESEDMVPAQEVMELQMAYDSLNMEARKLQSRLREAEQKVESYKQQPPTGAGTQAEETVREIQQARTETTQAREEVEIWKRRYKMLLEKHRSLRQEVDKTTDRLLADQDPSIPQDAFDMPLS